MKRKDLKNSLKFSLTSKEELENIKKDLSFKNRRLPYIIAYGISVLSLIALIIVVSITFISKATVSFLNMSLSKEKTTINTSNMDFTYSYDYYFAANDNIIITINLDNQEQFEILSVTINDYKYNSYEFLDGSNNHTIYLKYTLPEKGGVTSIYVDSIKYIDGTNIKESEFVGDRELEIAIKYDIPQIDIYNIVKTTTTISFSLAYDSSLDIMIQLYNGDTLIYQTVGSNSINIANLEPGTNYTLAITTNFDLLDGLGLREIELLREDITTDLPFTYSIISGIDYIDIITDYDIVVYLNGQIVDKHLTNLSPNTNYHLIFEYEYNGKTYQYNLITNTINSVFYDCNLTKLSNGYVLSFKKAEEVKVTEIIVNSDKVFNYSDDGSLEVVCMLKDIENIEEIKVRYQLLDNYYEEVLLLEN